MFSLKVVIARLLGTITKLLDNPAQPTQTVGLASQEPTTPHGNKRSAQSTKRQSPAQPRTQKKPKVAPSTKVASKDTSKKQKHAPTARSRKAPGCSTPTPVSKTPQHAKQAAKRKP